MLRRYQVAGRKPLVWGKLTGPVKARAAIFARLKGYVSPIRWVIRPEDKDPIQRETRGRLRSALAMVADAKARNRTTRYKVKGSDLPVFRLLVGGEWSPYVPPPAGATTATKQTIAYGQEMTLVFPEWKSLGLYVNKTSTSGGKTVWYEHPWASAQDAGVLDADGEGFETHEPERTFFLEQFHRYTMSNASRLGVVDHIYNGRRWRSRTGYKPEAYSGSDDHSTHTHTAFADHGGVKPPWV